jgi:hypothetical protein
MKMQLGWIHWLRTPRSPSDSDMIRAASGDVNASPPEPN